MRNKTIGKQTQDSWLARLNGPWHERALWVYMVIVVGHWLEHLVQMYQIYVMGWMPKVAQGVLGVWFPVLAASEVLHFVYNLFLWGGLLLLLPGFVGRARTFWKGALAAQTWHFFEHILLQVQWMTGVFLFGAAQQISIGQLWFPRPELHFVYNLIVFVPMALGMFYYFNPPAGRAPTEDGVAQPA